MITLIHILIALYAWLIPTPESIEVSVDPNKTLAVDDMSELAYTGLRNCLDQGRCSAITVGNITLFMKLETSKAIAWMPALDPAVTGDNGLHL